MVIKPLNPEHLDKYRGVLLRYIHKFGEQRITHKAMNWLQSVSPESLRQPGNLVLLAVEDGFVAGFSGTSNFGLDVSFVVIHSRCRNQQLGRKLIQEQIVRLGAYSCMVAADNVPSLKMCFRAGLQAVNLVEGPTGKPTFRFELR